MSSTSGDPLRCGESAASGRSSDGKANNEECAIDVCASLAHYRHVIFVETRAFTRRVAELLDDANYGRLQVYLAAYPEAGDVMEGTGGLRKIRVAMGYRGKRAGARAIYYHFVAQSQIAMLLIFSKNEQEDLTSDQRKVLATIMDNWKRGYDQVL